MDEAILKKYIKGEASEEECVQVETWSEASTENRKVLEQLYYIVFIDERLSAMQSVDVETSLARLKAEIARKANKRRRAINWKRTAFMAAAFMAGIICTCGSMWGIFSNTVSDYTVFTEAGQRAQVVLPDGSKVWLNSSTKLAYKTSFWKSDRQVDLTGEAYFEVAHDKSAPFIVNSKDIKTCVLGTKFNIRARDMEQRVVTTLLQGSVRIDSPMSAGEGFLLEPGQTLDVDTHTYKAELIEYPYPTDVLQWMDGRLRFEQASLLDITSNLEKHFDVRFEFVNDQLKSESFTCEFNTDDRIDDILFVLSQTNRFDYKVDGKIVKLIKPQR